MLERLLFFDVTGSSGVVAGSDVEASSRVVSSRAVAGASGRTWSAVAVDSWVSVEVEVEVEEADGPGDEPDSPSSAHAVPVTPAMAAPIPSATAKAPTRPTYRA
ncbi:hypothetical protein TUM20985_15380 [Mycobacterium antarcticum]|nr:hypothetical protein TUM20985_15380 [Mycolicibacterium sp. TUM20985]